MAETFAQMLPWIFAGAFLPTWTSYVILLLGTDRPLRTSSSYVLGNASWRLALGFTTLFVVSATAPETRSEGITLPPAFVWALAATLIGTGFWLATRKPKMGSDGRALPKWIRAFRGLPPWAAFGYAIYNCAMPGAQWVYFLGGTTVIATSGLLWTGQLILLVVFVALLESMLVTPIVIYYRRRERARITFDRLETWLVRHATRVFGVILLTIGGLFVWFAINGGQIGGAL